MRISSRFFTALLIVTLAVLASPIRDCNAQENNAAVETTAFLDTNTIGYLHVDLQEFDFAKAFDLLNESDAFLAIWNAAPLRQEMITVRPLILGTVDLLKMKGARDAFVFFSLSDPMGSSIIVPAENEKQAKKFKSVFPMGELIGNNLVIGRKGSVQKVLDFGLPKRPDADLLLEIAEGHHHATIVISPSEAHSRVIREVMPRLPKPLDDVTGDMIANGLWLSVITIDSLDPINSQVRIASKTEGSSKVLATKLVELFEAIADGQIKLVPGTKELMAQAIDIFKPEQSGKVIKLAIRQADIEKLKPTVGGLMAHAASQAAIQRCSNNLRNVALGILNRETAEKKLAGYANFDDDGKPLLSWRVHILPFLGEGKLYKQFHHDEPWNSPHNIKLVEKIPEIYRIPFGWTDRESTDRLLKEGKTAFVMPRGNGMFGTRDGLRIQDITDGTSNTIMVVTTKPDKAVVWSKPEDIEFDPENPKAELFSETCKQVPVALGDSSTQVLSAEKIDDVNLRRLLQIADGEVVEFGDW